MSFSVKVKVRLRIIVKMRSVRSDPEEMVFERKEKYRAEERESSERWAGREKTIEKHRWA